MSFAKKCDRCGVYYDSTKFELNTYDYVNGVCIDKDYDLCEDCQSEFEDFMNGVKPEKLIDRLLSKLKKG